MAEVNPSPTISLRERSFPMLGPEERLPKWVVVSLLLHLAFIASLFLIPLLPTGPDPIPVYTVDLVGGERIGAANLGTVVAPPPKLVEKTPQVEKSLPPPEPKPKKEVKEVKKEKPEIEAKVKEPPAEKKPPVKEKIIQKEKTKPETLASKPVKETKSEPKETVKAETASADSVRERLMQSAIQSAVDRAKSRIESAEKPSKEEPLSAGTGEGIGAGALGPGGRGGPGIVKGMDFIIYKNRMLNTIKENWAWIGQRSNLKVVVHFTIKETGEIAGLKIVQPSGDPSYDESVLRAVKKSSPLPAPPESYRTDFANVELTFRPRDLGA